MDNKILESLFNGDFKSFKEMISNALYAKLNARLEEASGEIADSMFNESSEELDEESEDLEEEPSQELDESKKKWSATSLETLKGKFAEKPKGWKIGDPHEKYNDPEYVIKDYKNAAEKPQEERSKLRKNLLNNFGHKLQLHHIVHLRNWEAAGLDPDAPSVLRRTKELQDLFKKRLHESQLEESKKQSKKKQNYHPHISMYKDGVGNEEQSVQRKVERLYTESTDDVAYKTRANHSDKDGYPEGKKEVDATEKGGEFLVDLTFVEGNNTKLENFRVVGTSKADIESKLDNFFGKGKFVIDNIKLSEELEEQRFEKGQDVGKPGFGFKKIEKKAGAFYGSKESGKKVAGAILKKILAKKHKKKVNEDSLEENYKIYHDSYTSAVDEAGRHAEARGYKHDPEEVAEKIGNGPRKPSEGQTNSFHLNLLKDGEKSGQMHHLQIYGMGNGKYELNQYIDTPSRSKKKIKEEVENIDEVSKDTLTSYTKKASKDLGEKERKFFNPHEKDVMNIVQKAAKIAQRKKGIEDAQTKIASGEVDPEKASKITMKAHYVPKKKKSKVSAKAMKELQPSKYQENKLKEETYMGDESYKNGDKSKEYSTHYECFSDVLEAAKKHAIECGYKHDPEEFSKITNSGFIKPGEDKTHAFHVGLYHKSNGKEAINKIHNFQITGKGDGKFYLTQDIK